LARDCDNVALAFALSYLFFAYEDQQAFGLISGAVISFEC
jgi:hypothetical protein